mmetsp:Transcript_8943/g.17790  ORF Transcript_8943/g.17790 Transcript_8943/m.17790 type:complete len:323 (-) Transcript_8943:134-1102(-)
MRLFAALVSRCPGLSQRHSTSTWSSPGSIWTHTAKITNNKNYRTIAAQHRRWAHRHSTLAGAPEQPGDDVNTVKAAFMVIGDEILSGSVQDSNTPWLAKFLRARGVDLVRVEFVPDTFEDIGDSLLRLRRKVSDNGFVFTSGGIGPTHDDISYQAIAKALGLTIELHQETVERMKVHYAERNIELNEARLRMAQLPSPCTVLPPPENSWVPLCCCGGNVYILPGIPRLFTTMIENHADVFRGHGEIFTRELFSQMGEGDFSEPLRRIAAEFKDVRIGSYPNTKWNMSNPAGNDALDYRVKIIVEGKNQALVDEAVAEIDKIV